MKKLFTLCLIALAFISAKAQIANNGFENWTTVGNYEDPNGWTTMNSACAGPFYSCTKSTDHYPASIGNYSMRLENNTSLTQLTGANGMAITGGFSFPFQPAFPITGHPTSLHGYFKFDSQADDTAFIRLLLFQNGTWENSGSLIGTDAFLVTSSVANWTSFDLTLANYTSADSASLFISAFYPENQTDVPNGNSVLYVDNLSFDNLISSVPDLDNSASLTLYPNPAKDVVTINNPNKNQTGLIVNTYNVLGALINTEVLEHEQQQINLAHLSNGIYLLEIKCGSYTQKQKLTIER